MVLYRGNTISIGLTAILALILAAFVAVQPATAQGSCESPYLVQPNDNLTEIAMLCDTTVEALLEANPEIKNPSLIFPGQALAMPGEIIPDTGGGAELLLNPQSGPSGTTVTVEGTDFPANTQIRVGHGVLGSEPVDSETVRADESGNFTTEITVPEDAGTRFPWVVLATPLIGGSEETLTTEFEVTAAGAPDVRRYTVRPGDTLSEIAARFETTVQALERANPQIDDPRLIFPGQELAIPGSLIILPDTGARVYVVERGDTLSEIAVRFGTTVDDLLEENSDIENPSRILPGQRLEIPTPVDVIPDTGETVYVVQRGDTLSEIAVRFRTTVQALLESNPEIEDPNFILTGQRIAIPGTTEN